MDLSMFITVACLLLCIKEGSTLSCYQCDSNNEADCQEFFDHGHKDTITVKSQECTVDAGKYCIKTTGVWGGVVGTTRFCSSRDMGNQCQFITYPDHDRTYRACIYTCGRSHCNGARSISSFSAVVLLVPALAGVWARLRWH